MVYFQRTAWGKAKKQIVGNIKYDSGFEAKYAEELIARKKVGEILNFEAHQKIPLLVNGYLIANYYIDFVVYYPDGEIEYVECKGYPSEIWKMKWKIFEATYSNLPNVKLTVVMQGKFKIPKARLIR